MDNFFQEYYKAAVISEMMHYHINPIMFAVFIMSLSYVLVYQAVKFFGAKKSASSESQSSFDASRAEIFRFYGFSKIIMVGSFIALVMGNLGYYLASIHSNEMVKNTICMEGVRGIDVPSYLKTFDKVSEADREPFRGLSLGEAIDVYCVGTMYIKTETSVSGEVSEVDVPGVPGAKLIRFDKADIIVNF